MKKILISLLFILFCCAFVFAQNSKSLQILEMPQPKLPDYSGTIHVQGTVRLRVEFLSNGQIGKVFAVSGLPYKLTENAMEVAKKIKFELAVEDDNAITVNKIIEYVYSWDGGWQNSSSKYENNKKDDSKNDEKAAAIIKRAVENLGGEKYLRATSQIGRGRYSILRDGALISFQSFVDVIVFPDKERTEFKTGGAKNVQTNNGGAGWIFDGAAQVINAQSKEQIENYKRGIRTSLDNLLRDGWRKENAKLQFGGRRQAGVGRRNDIVKLVFADDFTVEFEFSDDGMPVKSIYRRKNADGEIVVEEDRYAQFIDVQGIKTPFIIDHFSNGMQTSRVNYESIEFNKAIPDSIFVQPKSAKELKKDLKL